MKYNRNGVIQLLILSGLGLAVVLSLVIPQKFQRDQDEPLPEISVVIREPDGSGWFSFRQGLDHAAGDLGADIRFIPLSSENDSAEQEKLIQREAQGGTDVFVIAAADPERLEQKLPELVGSCPVVALESDMSAADDRVVPENRSMGEAMARDLLREWDGGTVLLINSAEKSTAINQRLDAAYSVLRGAGVPLEVRTCLPAQLPEQLPRFASQTAAHDVMVFDHSATEKAAEARASGGMTGEIYGVGTSSVIIDALERGVIRSVAAWSDYAAGYLSAARAIKLCEGTYTWKNRDVDFFIVHREDIYDPEIQKILFPVAP